MLSAALATLTLFTNLGGRRLEPDEAYYALATDDIHATGRWATVYIHPSYPYFNKPPLYMWLSALTYDRFASMEVRYRFWSAAFGVLAAGLTGALGTRVAGPAAGIIAASILSTNRAWLFEHGARFGGMDAALAACLAAMLLLYVRDSSRPSGGLWRWAIIGVLAGLASLLKPLGGVPMLGLLAIHAALAERVAGHAACSAVSDNGRHPPRCWKRPALAIAVTLAAALAIGAPWYVLQYARFGHGFTGRLFGQQLVDRVAGVGPAGEHKPWFFYFVEIFAASNVFKALLLPAMAWAVYRLMRGGGDRRFARSLLLFVVVGWLVVFSISSGKFLHYLYPMFPAVAVMIAAALVDWTSLVGDAMRRRFAATPPPQQLAGGLAVALAAYVGYVAAGSVAKDGAPLPAWEVYQAFAPAIRDGRMSLYFLDVPHSPANWPSEQALRPNHMIYLSHMTGGRAVESPAQLSAELRTGRPAVVLFSRGTDLAAVPELLATTSNRNAAFSIDQLPFAAAVLNADRLLRQHANAGAPPTGLRPARGATLPLACTGTGTIDVEFPLPQPARLTVTVRRPDDVPPRTVRWHFGNASDEPEAFPPMPLTGTHRLSVGTAADDNARRPRRSITLHARPADDDPTPVRFEIIELLLETLPPPPVGEAGLGLR